MRFGTKAIRSGQEPDPITGAVVPPIHMASTYVHQKVGELKAGWEYARSGNPTRGALERSIAALENARYGLAFASGMAAETAVSSLVRTGEHIVATKDIYGGTFRLFRHLREKYSIQSTYADFTDLNRLEEAFTPNTRLVWIESPSNPTLVVLDIAAIAELAHRHNALLVVDNTFASPYLQTPLDLGADIVLHSTTKYIGGHSDVLGGCVVAQADDEFIQRIRSYQVFGGAAPSPFDCWLLLRSLPTLPCRVRAQSEGALRVARFLADHPAVAQVDYPGLPTHPGHEIARRQMRGGFGGMVSFQVRGAEQDALNVAARVRLFTRATSLGGVESLIEHRASVEGPNTTTPRTLLRLSIGLEHPDDLIADLANALDLLRS